MPRILLENAIPLFVEPSPHVGASNPFATLPCIEKLARIAASAQGRGMLEALCVFASYDGKNVGYASDTTRHLYHPFLAMLPADKGKDACNLLAELAVEFDKAWQTAVPAKRSEVAEKITAGISEAIVHELLLLAGRPSQEIISDAHFDINGTPLTRCNVDRVWASPVVRKIELYECKNYPARLFEFYAVQNQARHADAWKRSKLYLMLEVQRRLRGQGWGVHAGCVTIRPRFSIERSLTTGAPPPSDLTVYCLEDLTAGTFPPPRP